MTPLRRAIIMSASMRGISAGAPEYDRFKEDLAHYLGNIAFRKELDAYIERLKSKAVIERGLPDASD